MSKIGQMLFHHHHHRHWNIHEGDIAVNWTKAAVKCGDSSPAGPGLSLRGRMEDVELNVVQASSDRVLTER